MCQELWEIIGSHECLKISIASSRPVDNKIGSDLIMWYQNTDYSHVLIIVNDMVFQASKGFTNNVPLSEFLLEHKIVNIIEIQKEKCDFKFLFSNLGKRYGYNQIVDIALKFLLVTKFKIIRRFKYKDNGTQNLICSEYVGKFLMLEWVNDLTNPKEIIEYLLSIQVRK